MSKTRRTESSLQIWLNLFCERVPGAEMAVAVIARSGGRSPRETLRWPRTSRPSPRLLATLEQALDRRQTAIQESTSTTARSTTCVAVPIVIDGEGRGAIGIALAHAMPGAAKRIAEKIQRSLPGFARMIEIQSERDRLRDVLPALESLLDHEELAAATHSLASSLASGLGCERCSVGLVEKHRALRVVAISNAPVFAEEGDAVQEIRAAMCEAIEQDALIECPSAGPAPPHEIESNEALREERGSAAVISIPIAAHGVAIGALTCEWAGAATPQTRALLTERLAATSVVVGPILALAQRADASIVDRARARVGSAMRRRLGSDGPVAKLTLAGIAILICCLGSIPAPYRVTARATLEGRIQRVLVAPVEGYLGEAHARAGDLVSKGQVMARLDDRDLRLEQRKWQSHGEQLQREYRQALAGGDRTQVRILRAQIDKAAAELALVEELLQRTSIVAPFDGVVLTGDLDRGLGSPVERGDVLFEVAPLDGYRIIVEVDDRDIADVSVGQRGRMVLSALPDHSLDLLVERIAPISNAQNGRNYFRVEARLDEPTSALRPGMEGIAKIDTGRRRLLWIWTHELFDWLRLAAWSFIP